MESLFYIHLSPLPCKRAQTAADDRFIAFSLPERSIDFGDQPVLPFLLLFYFASLLLCLRRPPPAVSFYCAGGKSKVFFVAFTLRFGGT